MDSKSRDPHKILNYLKIPVNPPYLQPPETTVNDLGLPTKYYYTTGDICKVLGVLPDTFRQRIYRGFYPEFQKIAGKRIFSKEQIKELIKVTDKLIQKGILSAGKID